MCGRAISPEGSVKMVAWPASERYRLPAATPTASKRNRAMKCSQRGWRLLAGLPEVAERPAPQQRGREDLVLQNGVGNGEFG